MSLEHTLPMSLQSSTEPSPHHSVFSTVAHQTNLWMWFSVRYTRFFLQSLPVFSGLFVNAEKNLDLRILRIYSTSVERKDYPGPKLQTHHPPDAECPEWAQPYSLHHMIRSEARTEPEFKALREIEKRLKRMESERKIASGKFRAEYAGILKSAEEKLFEDTRFDVVFCTCNEASGRRVRSSVTPRQCIIDECGMAYEPETIVPIGLCEHVTLIGDHMQLQPVIQCSPAKDSGLEISLFERYAKHYKAFMCRLKTQYRMVS